jgi:acetyltransferase
LRKAGVPFHRHIEVSVQCLASAADYHAAKRRLLASVAPERGSASADAVRLISQARAANRHLLEHECLALLAAYGVPVPPHMLMQSAADAAGAIKRLGDVPMAVKVVSKDVIHKSEVGGVRLNVAGVAALQAAYESVTRVPGASITGALVAPMAARGTEVIIGVSRDPTYGPVMMFGLGGTLVEVLRDVVFRALPLTHGDAMEMIDGLRYREVLDGVRGAESVNKAALARLLVAVSHIALRHPDIAAIDLNPVIANGSGSVIADARILIEGL